jgi:hypothetical protein
VFTRGEQDGRTAVEEEPAVRVERGLTHWSSTVVTEPVYVVEFWTSGSEREQWRVLDAEDVEDVMDWARRRQIGRVLSVAIEHHDEYGTSVLRLLGESRAPRRVVRSA